jgi:hypothetical protein
LQKSAFFRKSRSITRADHPIYSVMKSGLSHASVEVNLPTASACRRSTFLQTTYRKTAERRLAGWCRELGEVEAASPRRSRP